MSFHVLLWFSLLIVVLSILIAFSESVSLQAYVVGIILLFAVLYELTVLLVRKAMGYPEKIRAKVSATLYVLGFFWLVLSVSTLLLSAAFYDPAAERGRLKLLHMIIFASFTLLGLSLISISAARRLWK
ncbi:MAG: hypothetical protein ABWW66_04190 [Archaeoglobaceae archaeon]